MLETIISCLQVDPSTPHDFGLSIGKRVMPRWHRIYPSLYKESFFLGVFNTKNDLQWAHECVFSIAMTQSALSLKIYPVFSNLHKQMDLPCKIILRAFLNYYLVLNCIIFVKRHDYVVSQIMLFKHKNAKNFKKKNPNKQMECK